MHHTVSIRKEEKTTEKVDQVIKDKTTLILETGNLGLSPGRQDHSLEKGTPPPNSLFQQIAPSDAAS